MTQIRKHIHLSLPAAVWTWLALSLVVPQIAPLTLGLVLGASGVALL